jgi:hypothetical protein
MRIVVLENGTLNHVVMIKNWIKIAEINNWKLVIFTSEECKSKLLKLDSKTIELKTFSSSSIKSFIDIIKFLKSSDMLVVNSMYLNYHFYIALFTFHRNSYFSIHNVNKWFFSAPTNDNLVKKIIKSCVFKIIYRLAAGVFVNSDNMKAHIRKYDLKKRVEILPFSLSLKEKKYPDIRNLTIVYPGIVSQQRKRYGNFLKAATLFPDIKFILLGKLLDDTDFIADYIDVKKLDNVIYFPEYVEQEEFDLYMNECNLLFSDINVKYGDEIYGQSKDSGVSYLMAEYCIPLLVNKDFNNLYHLHPNTLYFDDFDDIIQVIDSFSVMSQSKYDIIISNIDNARLKTNTDKLASNIRLFFLHSVK